MGILRDTMVEPTDATRSMRVDGRQAFTCAPVRIFEPAVELGDGPRGPTEPPRTVQFARSGLVACRRAPAPRDCLFKLVVDDMAVGGNSLALGLGLTR